MLSDFLKTLRAVLAEEEAAYRALCAALGDTVCPVRFMPSVTLDLWSVYALQSTDAGQYAAGDAVYMISVGAYDFVFQPMLEKLIRSYRLCGRAELPLSYGAKLDRMLLLHSDRFEGAAERGADLSGVNVVYMGFDMPGGTAAHLFFVFETTMGTWNRVFEDCHIPCQVLIDTRNGSGGRFDMTDLHAYFRRCADADTSLLPRLYFAGKYVTPEVPKEFSLLHTVTEHRPHGGEGRLYLTNY